ncbi:unnamed protein product [Arctogadus glacialis]
MSVVALSPIGGEPTSPMITSVTMTHSDSLEEAVFPGHTPCRQRRAPPLHAGADWKVLLHLPEVQTWLRAAAGRVSQLTHSAGQDAEHRHIDTHLLQLKPGGPPGGAGLSLVGPLAELVSAWWAPWRSWSQPGGPPGGAGLSLVGPLVELVSAWWAPWWSWSQPGGPPGGAGLSLVGPLVELV